MSPKVLKNHLKSNNFPFPSMSAAGLLGPNLVRARKQNIALVHFDFTISADGTARPGAYFYTNVY